MARSVGLTAFDAQKHHSSPQLTLRESAVLRLLADGLTAAAIAHVLSISERTIHKHLQNLYRKLGVSDRLSAVVQALGNGQLQLTTAVAAGPMTLPQGLR